MAGGGIVLFIVIAYMAIMLGVGYYSTRKIESNEDFLVAGRRLGPVMLAGTLAATEIGGGSSLGVVEKAYGDWGMSAIWYVLAMAVTLVLMSLVAPKLRSAMVKTIPEYFSRRYDSKSGLLTSIIMLLPLVGLTAVQFIASGVVLSVVTGWDYVYAVMLVAVVVTIYSTMGGLWAVSMTDFIQMFMIIFGMAIVLPFSLEAVGGWETVTAHLQATNPESLSFTAGMGSGTLITLIVMYFMSFTVGQEVTQRLYAAKDERSAVKGALLAAAMFAAFALIPASLGLIARTMVDLDMIDGQMIMAEGARYALPVLAVQIMPPVLVGLLFAGIISATMSSASSNLLGAGSIFANDIYKKYVMPDADDAHLLKRARITMFGVGLVGLGIAVLNTKAIITLLMFCFTLRAGGAFIPYVIGHYWKKAGKQSAWAALVLGSGAVLAVQYELISFFGLDAIFAGLAISLLSYVIAAHIWPNNEQEVAVLESEPEL